MQSGIFEPTEDEVNTVVGSCKRAAKAEDEEGDPCSFAVIVQEEGLSDDDARRKAKACKAAKYHADAIQKATAELKELSVDADAQRKARVAAVKEDLDVLMKLTQPWLKSANPGWETGPLLPR